MKHISILFLALILVSCGGDKSVDSLVASGDIKELKDTKAELLKKKKALEEDIAKLELAINSKSGSQKTALVSIYKVKDTLFNHYLEIQGDVMTDKNIIVYPQTPGVLTNVYVKEGQRVSKGQTLARVDDGGLSQQIAQMQVQANLAKTTFDRQKNLWDQKIGSEIQYLQAKAGYEGQLKAIGSMKQQLAKSAVTAPYSGIIDKVITEQGSVVSPGASQLFRIVNLNDMFVSAQIPEIYLPAIKTGSEVEVNLPVIDEQMMSKVRQSSSVINETNRTYTIEVPVVNKSGNVKPNLTAKLRIKDYENTNALLVPLNVLSENEDGAQYVMIAAMNDKGEQVAKRQIVTTGKSQGDYIEIKSGLKSGMNVINRGARSVREDQLITIK